MSKGVLIFAVLILFLSSGCTGNSGTLDLNTFTVVNDDSKLYRIPDEETDFSSGKIEIEAAVITADPVKKINYGSDREVFYIDAGDVISLGGPNGLIITVTEVSGAGFRFTTNIPLSESYSSADEKTEFFAYGEAGAELYDMRSGDLLCIYRFYELLEY